MDTRNLIRNARPFQGLPGDILDIIEHKAAVRTYDAGVVIVNETEPVSGLSVVLDGRVKLSKTSSEGKEQTLALLEQGEPFGLCTAFASSDFPASAVTLTRTTVLTLPGSTLQEIARQEPLILLNVIRLLSERLRETMELVETLSLKDLPQRIALFILHDLSRQAPGHGITLELAVTHRELAKIVGASPEALSRALRRMAQQGILTVDGRKITVHDRRGLEELAKG